MDRSGEEIFRSSTGESSSRWRRRQQQHRSSVTDSDRQQVDASQRSLNDSSRNNNQSRIALMDDSSQQLQQTCSRRNNDPDHIKTCHVCQRLTRFGVSRFQDGYADDEDGLYEEETTRRLSRGNFTPSFTAMEDIDFDAWLMPPAINNSTNNNAAGTTSTETLLSKTHDTNAPK